MILKKQLEKENRELKEKVRTLESRQVPCGQKKFHCPDCGNPVLINNGAYDNRQGKKFYCSVGHIFTFTN